jgi:hypothetical protein
MRDGLAWQQKERANERSRDLAEETLRKKRNPRFGGTACD